MMGELKPNVAISPFDPKPIEREMPWVPLQIFLQKFLAPPDVGYAKGVLPLMTILCMMPWVAPTTTGSATMITTFAGFAFIYNRGTADVKRDEWGQIGEVRCADGGARASLFAPCAYCQTPPPLPCDRAVEGRLLVARADLSRSSPSSSRLAW